MCGNTRNTVVTDAAVLEDQPVPTHLGTTLTLDATGDGATDNLELRLSTLAHVSGGRVTYGEITLDELGRPTCPVGFDCATYLESTPGHADPAAIRDFEELIEGVNADRCIFTGELIAR